MSYLWIVRFCILMLIQIITSVCLIYKQKKRVSYFSEILLSVCSMLYGYFIVPIITNGNSLKLIEYIYKDYSFTKDKFLWYIIEYLVLKILLLILVWSLKYFSFYAIKSIIKKNGKIAKIGYKIFGKKRFARFASKMWNKVDYGIRIKKGMPERANKRHQATGVKFDEDGFPEFKAIATIKLDRKYYRKTRETHFYQCNKMLYESIQKSKRMASKFTKLEIKKFKEGTTPSKYTWHHHQDKGVLQLVDSKIHENVKHRGGFSIWGKRE